MGFFYFPFHPMKTADQLALTRNRASRFLFGLAFFCMPFSALGADIIATKNVVTYAVSLEAITPNFLVSGGGGTAVLSFTITPRNLAKFTPKKITLTIDDTQFDVTGVTSTGSYEIDLVEGQHLRVPGHQYRIYLQVDNSESNVLTASVWKVTSRAVATVPQDRSRSLLGLGEEVELGIVPPLEGQLGAIDWSATGAGLASMPGQPQFQFMFLGRTPGTATVRTTIQGQTYTHPFTVVAPNQYIVQTNPAPRADTSVFPPPGPPNNHIGVNTIFYVAILPQSVNFYNLSFQENFNPYASQDQIYFPDGSIENYNLGIVPFGSAFSANTPSSFFDRIRDGAFDSSRLLKNGSYQNFGYKVQWETEYLDDYGTAVPGILGINTITSFTSSLQGTQNYLGVPNGAPQGPFQ